MFAADAPRCYHRQVTSPLTAEDVLPFVERLTPAERVRLLHLIATQGKSSSSAYTTSPPGREEFSSDTDPLAWEAEGWDEVG